jgi:hypothetical protein
MQGFAKTLLIWLKENCETAVAQTTRAAKVTQFKCVIA